MMIIAAGGSIGYVYEYVDPQTPVLSRVVTRGRLRGARLPVPTARAYGLVTSGHHRCVVVSFLQ